MINFLFCTVFPAGASKVNQTHKFTSRKPPGLEFRIPRAKQATNPNNVAA